MDKKITIWCIGVLVALFALPVESIYSQRKPMRGDVLYYLKIDTAGRDMGYLRMDSTGVNMKVDDVKGDYAMWYIRSFPTTSPHYSANRYLLFNKMTGTDTLRFDLPVVEDVIASKTAGGVLRWWNDLVFNEDSRNMFITSFKEDLLSPTFHYNLTMGDDGVVMLSSDTSSMQYNKLNFFVERVTVLPDPDKKYRLAVDTAGFPDIFSPTCNFLYADTTSRRDSLSVSDTISGDLNLWEFVIDKTVRDTAYFKIYNAETESLLALDIPAGNDTVAYMKNTGALNQWLIPFFIEGEGTGRFMVRDTAGQKDYYLGMKDSVIMLTSDTLSIKCLKFVLADEVIAPYVPDSSIVDSTKIYKVKYLNGADSGKYLGANILGERILLDSVYAHIPDGQFVVFQDNKYSLMNRAGNIKTDSLFFVCDTLTGDTIPNRFTNRRVLADTFEIVPITYGNIDVHKSKSRLGYEYMTPEELLLHSYLFSYTSTDTLNNLILGYDPSDSLAVLTDDSVKFILESREMVPTGAPAIAGIPQLRKDVYSMSLLHDERLRLTVRSGSLVMDTLPNPVSFYIREDSTEGKYYLVENTIDIRKVLVDSTRHAYLAPIDSAVTHHFAITQKGRGPLEEPDDNKYLTEFPDSKGKGLYELKILDPISGERKWLTKNFRDYAVLGREGESTLRAGSFTPYDLHLWIDTARGWGFNEEKPSFYIVKDVDTTATGFNGFNISGYFMHVMDSTHLPTHDDYVYTDPVSSEVFNRVNFVRATRSSANELSLASGGDIIGSAGEKESAINEYRFYLQEIDGFVGEYYIVTEAGYGDGGRTNARGYLSVANGVLYFGPRESENAVTVSFSSSTVSNEVIIVKPPVIEEINNDIAIIGGTGQIDVRNAMGQDVNVFNILGQLVVKKSLSSDYETIPVSRGIMIVKIGAKTQKVVVK